MQSKKSFLGRVFGFFWELEVREIAVLFLVFLAALYVFLAVLLGTPGFFSVVVSGSMEPALYRGDVVIISALDEIGSNDIVVFKKNSEIIVHRVVELRPDGFKTKGDKNPLADYSIVKKQDVLGKAVFVIPKIGHVNLFVSGK